MEEEKTEVPEMEIEHFEYTKERGIELRARHPMVFELTNHLVDWFKDCGGENYVEMGLFHEELGLLSLTLQRVSGKTPAQKLADVEAENAILKKGLKELAGLRVVDLQRGLKLGYNKAHRIWSAVEVAMEPNAKS